jgi:hypothetical protein
MALPFYLGQPVDDVLKVAAATKRKRRKVEFTGKEGTFTVEEGKRPIGRVDIDLAQDLTVRYFYDDCTLTFQRTCDDDDGGALCYRVTEITVNELH